MDFKEILYQYISENIYLSLIQSEDYQTALTAQRAAEDELAETFSAEQQQLFEEFTNKLFHVCELESYFYFCEALSIIRGLLTA